MKRSQSYHGSPGQEKVLEKLKLAHTMLFDVTRGSMAAMAKHMSKKCAKQQHVQFGWLCAANAVDSNTDPISLSN